MNEKQLRAQKIQRLRDKVRIRLNMIQQDFQSLQKEIDYEARELQAKPLLDPETGSLVDQKFQDEDGEEEEMDVDNMDEETQLKNVMAQNEQLMLTYEDTDALLEAYSNQKYLRT